MILHAEFKYVPEDKHAFRWTVFADGTPIAHGVEVISGNATEAATNAILSAAHLLVHTGYAIDTLEVRYEE